MTSQVIMTRRRSNRSATTPPSGPRATIGITRAAVVIPAHSAEWVRPYTRAIRARLYSQSPSWDTASPPSSQRNAG